VQVLELWRYPVKSLGGERLDAAPVTDLGIAGDRGWGLRDQGTGTVLTARREPRLLFASARLAGPGQVVITLPDGTETTDDGALSAWLGRPVTLARAGDEGGTYEAPMDFERDRDWVSWQGPGGAWHDSPRARLSLVGTATLGTWDRRRFRANVVLDGGGEDELVGTDVAIGGAVLRVTTPIDRCVMVTRAQPGLDRDLDVLRAINAERGACLAVGALVTTPGTIAVGDEVRPAPPSG
jgi:uncharacterized protein YcbX